MQVKGYITTGVVFAILVVLTFPWIHKGFVMVIDGWRHDPAKMIARLVVAFIIGQAIGWLIGHDQLGLFMRPFARFGIGQSLSIRIAGHLSANAATYWAAKSVEVLTDAIRIPVEGLLFQRYGFVPDALATLITQPLWTCFEVAEKIGGIVARPEVVGSHEQIELSIACVYGNLVRFGQEALIWFFGYQIYRLIGLPVENVLSKIVG